MEWMEWMEWMDGRMGGWMDEQKEGPMDPPTGEEEGRE
jgi:hypothetical protein